VNHLRIKPDEFNCRLFDEVQCLTCPGEYEGDEDDEKCGRPYWEEVQDAFRKLITYIQRYQFDCAMGELIFSCQEPCESHCLVLGTVEVRDGKLVRVCNTPRKYMWTAANLLPVLLYTVLTGDFDHAGEEKTHCCPDYSKFMPEHFLEELEFDKCGRRHVATALIKAIESVGESMHRLFNFTDTALVSREAVEKAGPEQSHKLNVKLTVSEHEAPKELAFLQAVQAAIPFRRGDWVRAYKKEGEVKSTLPDYLFQASPERPVGELLSRIFEMDKQVRDLTAQMEELKTRFPESEEGKKGSKRTQKDQ
jgi:hypothetical protein